MLRDDEDCAAAAAEQVKPGEVPWAAQRSHDRFIAGREADAVDTPDRAGMDVLKLGFLERLAPSVERKEASTDSMRATRSRVGSSKKADR